MPSPSLVPPCADRNLLFGILALQLDFITRDALIKGMNAWVLEKSKSIGSILQEQGALRQDAHDLLDALVDKHLEKHDHDVDKSLASLSSLGNDLQVQLHQIADPDLQASLARVAQHTSASEELERTRSLRTAPAAPGSRFRILRPHARGGLGQVYAAPDEELHRQ